MEHHKKDHHRESGGHFNGFLFGIIVGVALTLLFTTKKGRRILRSLTEEGLDKVNKWEDLISKRIDEKIENINDDLEEQEFVEVVEEPVTRVTEPPVVSSKSGTANHASGGKKEPSKEEPEVRHTVRRFFKAAKKK